MIFHVMAHAGNYFYVEVNDSRIRQMLNHSQDDFLNIK